MISMWSNGLKYEIFLNILSKKRAFRVVNPDFFEAVDFKISNDESAYICKSPYPCILTFYPDSILYLHFTISEAYGIKSKIRWNNMR